MTSPTTRSPNDTHPTFGGGGPLLDPDHGHRDTPKERVGVDFSPTTHRVSDTQSARGGGDDPDQPDRDTHFDRVGVEPSPSPTTQGELDTHVRGGGGNPHDPTIGLATPGPSASESWGVLRVLAEMYYDAQKVHTAMTNRLHSGTVWPDPVHDALESARIAKDKLGLAMRKAFKTTAPEIHAWVKATPGLGEHLFARLLGVIGDPRVAYPHHWEGDGSDRVLVADEPYERTVSQLWAYCGIGDPNRKRRKGMTADEAAALGQPQAKMLCHLIADGAMKCAGSETRARSPYRDVYDLARMQYDIDREWTPGHCHNAALRKTAKAIVRDLWRATPPPISATTPRYGPVVG